MCLCKLEMFVAKFRKLVGMCVHSALYDIIGQPIKFQNIKSKAMSTNFLNIMQRTYQISEQTFQVIPYQDYYKPYRLLHFHQMASFLCVFFVHSIKNSFVLELKPEQKSLFTNERMQALNKG